MLDRGILKACSAVFAEAVGVEDWRGYPGAPVAVLAALV